MECVAACLSKLQSLDIIVIVPVELIAGMRSLAPINISFMNAAGVRGITSAN